jgi:hypothetical protein
MLKSTQVITVDNTKAPEKFITSATIPGPAAASDKNG